MGVPPPRMRDHIKWMIIILECMTPALKIRWPGHPSIPPRVFGPSQCLMMPPVQLTRLKSTSKPTLKPKLTLKPLPANATSKLIPPKTQSDVEECRHTKLIAGGDIRRVVGADVAPINNFVQWFQAISANMNTEAQRRALATSRKAAKSVFADVGDKEASLITAPTAPAQGESRKVEYSAEMAVVGFTP